MKNPLNDYMIEHSIRNGEMAELVGVSYSTLHRYRRGEICPSLEVARKIYTATKGKVPLTFWGYTLFNGKFVRGPKVYKHRLKQAKYSPYSGD